MENELYSQNEKADWFCLLWLLCLLCFVFPAPRPGAEEQEKRKEAEMIAEDFTNAKLRSEKKIKALEDQVDSFSAREKRHVFA